MHDVSIVKAANHMNDRINLTDVSQELVTKTFTLRCSLYQSGNIHKLNCSMYYFSRMMHLCQNIQALVRNRHDTNVWLDRAEWVVGSLCCSCLG